MVRPVLLRGARHGRSERLTMCERVTAAKKVADLWTPVASRSVATGEAVRPVPACRGGVVRGVSERRCGGTSSVAYIGGPTWCCVLLPPVSSNLVADPRRPAAERARLGAWIKHDGYRLMRGAIRPVSGCSPATATTGGARSGDRGGGEPGRAALVLIDGEAVACHDNGLAVFERLRRERSGRRVFLCASTGWKSTARSCAANRQTRKATLASLLRARLPGLRF